MNKQEFTITVYTENQVGLLNRIAIIFTRRKINIDSLNTSPTEVESVHRFTIVINETEDVVRKLCRQIEKQVEVLKAYYNTNDELIWQEMALYKVPTDVIADGRLKLNDAGKPTMMNHPIPSLMSRKSGVSTHIRKIVPKKGMVCRSLPMHPQ